MQARPQVADLGDRRPAAAVQLAAEHQSAADAGADGHIEHACRAAAGAEPGLGQRGHVAVVADAPPACRAIRGTSAASGKPSQPAT